MIHNLPALITTFVGRGNELTTLTHLLLDPQCRLVTLVGAGGAGKTRLAIEAAAQIEDHFRDGIYFVPLQPVASAELVVYALADALGVGLYEKGSPLPQLMQYLQPRQLLLIIDNLEHLLDASELVVTILAGAPGVKLLVTSREVLNLQGEQVFEVRGLPLTEMGDALQLFADRARHARHTFDKEAEWESIARICRLVGGMPLGIELAAAWVRTLSCAEIATEIERSADFLATDARNLPERHRSVRAVFDQSWRLLTVREQAVFQRLSVFQGQFTREAAEAVAEASLQTLSALVDQSLLRVEGANAYTIHELLRQYAAEKLQAEPDEQRATSQKHCQYYLEMLRQLDSVIKGAGQIGALDQIEAALGNIRAAWRIAVMERHGEMILPALECLLLYYQMRCRLSEGYAAFAWAADQFQGHDEAIYAWLRLAQVWFSGLVNQWSDAVKIEAAALFVKHRKPGFGAMFTMTLWDRLPNEILNLIDENLAAYRSRGDLWGAGWLLQERGSWERKFGQVDVAKAALLESLNLFNAAGDAWGATWGQAMLGLIAEDEGRLQEAYELYTTRLHTCQAVNDAGGIAWTLQQIAKISLELNNVEKAAYYCRESLRVALDISTDNSVDEAIERIASMYAQTGKAAQAAEFYAALLNRPELMERRAKYLRGRLVQVEAQLLPDVYQRAVEAGKRWSVRDLGWALLDELSTEAPRPPFQGNGLSLRELEVLELASEGLSNREIAERLVVTVGTVKKHMNNIFSKLGADTRIQAIVRGREEGLIP
jgi:predicted ATPase/DNA-binding CsgD family transcriptional regulator